jgi:hypothetical protein
MKKLKKYSKIRKLISIATTKRFLKIEDKIANVVLVLSAAFVGVIYKAFGIGKVGNTFDRIYMKYMPRYVGRV